MVRPTKPWRPASAGVGRTRFEWVQFKHPCRFPSLKQKGERRILDAPPAPGSGWRGAWQARLNRCDPLEDGLPHLLRDTMLCRRRLRSNSYVHIVHVMYAVRSQALSMSEMIHHEGVCQLEASMLELSLAPQSPSRIRFPRYPGHLRKVAIITVLRPGQWNPQGCLHVRPTCSPPRGDSADILGIFVSLRCLCRSPPSRLETKRPCNWLEFGGGSSQAGLFCSVASWPITRSRGSGQVDHRLAPCLGMEGVERPLE